MDCPACYTPNTDGARFCAKCGALLPASPTGDGDPLIGKRIGGRFLITAVLGEGGMGRVYTGEQEMGTSIRKVAVKTLLAQYTRDPAVVARFMRECATLSELEHPNTIKVYDFGKTDTGELYIAMELLTGVSLEKALESGALAAERVDRIVGQICGSLQEAHEKGIVHRDLKPANIYLTIRAREEDYVKVLDFGIAKRDEKHSKHEQKLTQQGTVLGTPPYMSPEQFRGHELDARSDVYSLGVMTYEMLTGRLPFDADTPWAWATQHMTAQPFPFETIPLGSQVPPKMKAAVMRALSKDKERRQQSAREFYDEITVGAAARLSVGPAGTSFLPSAASSGQFTGSSGQGVVSPSQHPSHPPGPPPAVYATQQRSVPTGSGQAYPAPASTPAPAKGGLGRIVAVIGVGAAAATVVAFLVFGGKSAPETPTPANTGVATVAPSFVTPDPPASTAPPPPEPSTSPSSAPSSAPTGPVHDNDCNRAIHQAGKGNVVEAVRWFNKCRGADKPKARAAIETAAMRAAKEGCSGMAAAKAAHTIDINKPLAMLKRKCGHHGGSL